MKKFLLMMLGVLMALPTFARDFTYEYEGQTITYTVIDEDAKTCETKKGDAFAGNSVTGALVLPANPKDGGVEYTLTSIGDKAFSNCVDLTAIVIPNSVTSIGESAFFNCSGLTSVVIPSSVTSIGESAFVFCSGLTSVIIGNSVISIGDYTFSCCSGLTSVNIPNSLTSIGDGTFNQCSSLTSIDIPNSVKSIGESAFSSCSGLTSVNIPNSLTSIGVMAFSGCSGLTSVNIPSSVTSIGAGAFYNCDGLKTLIIEDSDTELTIGGDALKNAPIENLTIGRNWIYLQEKAAITISITNLTLKGGVTAIPDYAFYWCYGLTSVIIPESVTSIGKFAFSNCRGLTSIRIPELVTSIGSEAFSGCHGLTSVIIPESVTSIGSLAFCDCRGLKTFIIEDADTELNIGKNALFISPIENLTIGRNWKYNANYTMTPDIKNLILTNGVTVIPESAFAYCRGLTSVIIPNSVAEIGTGAFDECTALQDITLGQSLKNVNANSFTGCNFDRLAIADGTDKLMLVGFWDSFNISDLYMGRQIEYTSGFKTLTNLTVGNLIGEISNAQFKGATNLKTVTLGSGLKTIGDEAFSGLSNLEEIIVPPSVETIGASAFAGNSALKSIIMGHSVKTIGEKAFDGCPAATVSITAQTPPSAPNNTFSNYTGKLYLQGENAVNAYYDALTCWNRFDGLVMIEPTEMQLDGDKKLTGKPGDTFQLTAKLMPEDVTLPQIFWRSTNPDIATVDANGLVTLHADLDEVMTLAEGDEDEVQTCKIIAESLYADGPIAEVEVSNNITTDITEVTTDDNAANGIDYSAPYDVYNLNGLRVSNDVKNLSTGIYIIRQGAVAKKIAIK